MSQLTTLSIDKELKEKAECQAKKDKLSVSAVVRILLNEYAAGHIHIGACHTHHYKEK